MLKRPDRSGLPTGPLRIAVVTETYPPEINGVANTMRQLVAGLLARGHQITLIRPHQDGEPWPAPTPTPAISHADAANSDGDAPAPAGPKPHAQATPAQAPPLVQVLVRGLPIPGYRGLRFGYPAFRRLRRLWRDAPPDVAYVATQGPLGHAALHVARAQDVPVVAGFHTQFHQYSRHYGLGVLMRPIVDGLRRFHNRADATLVPTAALELELTRDGFENLALFSRGVDTALFDPQRRSHALRAHWGCRADDLVGLYVGRIAAEKNIALALAAFQAVAAVCPGFRAVLVGDGPELPRLRREHPEFIFTGAKVGEALATHYASADLFLFPSLTETFGNVVTEAMASGLPVLAFDYAAVREHVRNGHNGVAVPVGDETALIAAAVAASADRERLRALGAAARHTAETLGWGRVIQAVEQRLFEVIQRHGSIKDTGHGSGHSSGHGPGNDAGHVPPRGPPSGPPHGPSGTPNEAMAATTD